MHRQPVDGIDCRVLPFILLRMDRTEKNGYQKKEAYQIPENVFHDAFGYDERQKYSI